MNLFGEWIDIEIWELRAGEKIRIVDDKVQRRTEKDGSHYYYLKKAKDTLNPEEYENIYIGSKGQQKIKCFSPVKGVYWPIKFIMRQLRELTDEEKKLIETETDPLKKRNIEKVIYQKIYEAYFETVIDTETLNHYIYKIQKNTLRTQLGHGVSPTMILTVVIIVLAVFIILSSWAQYNYIMNPSIEFWKDTASKIMAASEKCGVSSPSVAMQPTPVV